MVFSLGWCRRLSGDRAKGIRSVTSPPPPWPACVLCVQAIRESALPSVPAYGVWGSPINLGAYCKVFCSSEELEALVVWQRDFRRNVGLAEKEAIVKRAHKMSHCSWLTWDSSLRSP